MKKPIKLTIFNIAFIIIAILSFSKRGLGLGFDPSNGALRFALSVSLSIFGILIFFYGNYLILTKVEKIDYKIDKLSTIDDCINALIKCLKTDPSFSEEISRAIEQLKTLQRRKEALTTLLEQNGVSESFSYLNATGSKANFYVFSNIKKIINRLIVFDNEEYLSNESTYDIETHRSYISGILKDNDNILKEYNSLLLAVSSIGDANMTNLEEIQEMTAALNHVLKGNPLERTSLNQTNQNKED